MVRNKHRNTRYVTETICGLQSLTYLLSSSLLNLLTSLMQKTRCWRAAHLVRTAGLLQLQDWGLAQVCAPAQNGLWAPLSSPSPPPPAERGQVHGPTWPAGVSEDQAASERGADSMRPGQAAATAPLGCLHTPGSTGLLSPEPGCRGVERCGDLSRAAVHENGGADGARCSAALPSPLTGCVAHK